MAAAARTAAWSSNATPRCSSLFSSATRVSHALQMARRASRGCWSRTTRVRDGMTGSSAQAQKSVGRRQRRHIDRIGAREETTDLPRASSTAASGRVGVPCAMAAPPVRLLVAAFPPELAGLDVAPPDGWAVA